MKTTAPVSRPEGQHISEAVVRGVLRRLTSFSTLNRPVLEEGRLKFHVHGLLQKSVTQRSESERVTLMCYVGTIQDLLLYLTGIWTDGYNCSSACCQIWDIIHGIIQDTPTPPHVTGTPCEHQQQTTRQVSNGDPSWWHTCDTCGHVTIN